MGDIELAEERRIIVRLIDDLQRDFAQAMLPGLPMGEARPLRTLFVAIIRRHFRGRGATISDLTRDVERNPRTIRSRVARLERLGLIERRGLRYFVVEARLNAPEAIAMTRRAIAHILQASTQLQGESLQQPYRG